MGLARRFPHGSLLSRGVAATRYLIRMGTKTRRLRTERAATKRKLCLVLQRCGVGLSLFVCSPLSPCCVGATGVVAFD